MYERRDSGSVLYSHQEFIACKLGRRQMNNSLNIVLKLLVLIIIFHVIISLAIEPVSAQKKLEFDESKLPQGGASFPSEVIETSEVLKKFYNENEMRSIWIGTSRMSQLIQRLERADIDGLRVQDYPIGKLLELHKVSNQVDKQSEAIIEAWFSAYFLNYASDLKLGRFKPREVDPELHWRTKKIDRVDALRKLAQSKSVDSFFDRWQPQNPVYLTLKRTLSQFRSLQKKGGWPIVSEGKPLKPQMSDPRIREIRARLAVTDGANLALPEQQLSNYDSDLVQTVKNFQNRHGLEADGIIGPKTLQSMNVSIEERIRQIVLSMERWRWMPEDYGDHFLAVNIARYKLFSVKNLKIEDEMPVVVGTPYHRTPVFSSEMKYLVINPYWNVPRSIATKELLPKLQNNPAALVADGYEVLSGNRAVDITSINWTSYNRQNFPFSIRQKPGPKNALGSIKFIFPNSYNVYLHDTPAQSLFEKTARAFSHGCIRVSRPADLAEWVLGETPGWNRDRINQALEAGKRVQVNLDKPLKVHIVYSTAWVGRDGQMHFGPDIYSRDKKLYQTLYGQKERR